MFICGFGPPDAFFDQGPVHVTMTNELAHRSLNVCIVVFPNAEGLAWRAALVEVARANGIAVMPDETAPDDGGPVIYLRDTLDDIATVPATDVVIVLSPALSNGTQTGLVEASALLARINVRHSRVSFIVGDDAAGGTMELFPGLTLCTPYPSRLVLGDELGALAIYQNGLPRIGAQAAWEPSIFLYDPKGSSGGLGSGNLELAGRARCLIYGPYLALPPGLWSISIRFSVDIAAAERKFRFEWGGAGRYAELAFIAGKPGIYEAVLTHDWDQPEASELRLILPESALAGHFELLSVEVEMVGQAAVKVAA